MSTIAFYAQFTKTLVGVNSLSVAWDVEQITRSSGARSALVTGGATSIIIGRRGLYGYLLTDADTKLYDYVATAITAGDVDQKEIAALWSMYEADALKIGGQTASAAAPVAFPATVGTSTYAGTDTAGTTTLLARILGTLAAGTHNPQTGDAYARLTGTVEPAIAAVPTNAELTTALASADDAVLAAIVALNNLSSAQAQAATAAALNAAIPGSPTADSVNALVKAIAATSGAGDVSAISHTITVQDGSGVLSGVLVQISTDSGKANVIRSGSTNDLGQVTFLLDAGTYYAWSSRAETDFTNPATVTVAA